AVAVDPGLEPAALDAFNERVAQFEEENPDIAVEVQEYNWTATTFTAQLAGGTLPDVFTVPFTDGRGLIERGQIAPIGDRVAELPYADSFNPNVAAAGSDADGTMWAVPIAAYGQGLHYNRTLFEEAGLNPDDPPTTWEEVREAAKTISEETGQAGYAMMTSGNTGGWILTTHAYTLGGRTEAVDGDTATATIDTPQVREALELLHTMRWEDDSMGAEFLYEWDSINQAFASGRIGMHISGGGNYGNLYTQNAIDPDDYGLAAVPLADDPDAGVLGGGTLAVVSADAEEPVIDAAVRWIDFFYLGKLTDQDAAVLNARTQAETGQPVGVPELPVFDQDTYDASREWIAEYVNVPLDQMAPYTEAVFGQPLLNEPTRSTQEVYALLDPVVQAVLTDEDADIDALLARAQESAQHLLDQE
ncbi:MULTISPECIES: ABC transporter substrate-binding protein, partial [unclassified Nocardiopsis]|uniref:ABC transporter substrate-binding protein n=2 Tax=Nocardiopsidaceae TaxID=83676 RepID=UPI00387B14A5